MSRNHPSSETNHVDIDSYFAAFEAPTTPEVQEDDADSDTDWFDEERPTSSTPFNYLPERTTQLDESTLDRAAQEAQKLLKQLEASKYEDNHVVDSPVYEVSPRQPRETRKPLKALKLLVLAIGLAVGSTSFYNYYTRCNSSSNCVWSKSSAKLLHLSQISRSSPDTSTASNGKREAESIAKFDSFRAAVNSATKASELTQVAQTADEWNTVAQKWLEATTLMAVVPETSEKYELAQQKAKEYADNMAYAQRNVEALAEPESSDSVAVSNSAEPDAF